MLCWGQDGSITGFHCFKHHRELLYMVQQESWTMVTKFTNVVGSFNNLFEYFLLSLFKLDLKCGLPRRKDA